MDDNLPESPNLSDVQPASNDLVANTKNHTSSPLPWIGLLILAAVLVSGLWIAFNYFDALLEEAEQENITLTPIAEQNIVIGTDATYPPMESVNDQDELVGYDIDLGNRLAEELGTTAEFKNIGWDDLFIALEKGEIDMILSAVTINAERQQMYDFSAPYINAGQVIITRKDTTDISSVTDLSDKKIAVQKGTTNEEEARKYTNADNVLTYDSFEVATTALVEGEADAIFSDLTNAKSIIDENSELKIASPPFTDDYYGIVVKKGNSALLERVDNALGSLRQQGYLQFLQKKWLE
jgi:polar amino acid transport system substrate-binding protein